MRDPAVRDVAISPGGDRIAVLKERREGDQRLAYVLLARVGDMGAPPLQAVIGDYDVHSVRWATDDRLLIWFSFDETNNGKKTGVRYGAHFYARSVFRLMAIGADGGNPVVLMGRDRSAMNYLWNVSRVVDPLIDDPRHVLMQVWDPDLYANTLQLVDIHTGEGKLLERGSETTIAWYTQNGVAVLRLDQSRFGRFSRLWGRTSATEDWRLIRKIRPNDFSRFDDFEPVGATSEAGVLLVATLADGDSSRTIRRFDLRSFELGEVVASHPERDIEGAFFDGRLDLVAASFTDDRTQYRFFDDNLARHYRAVQATMDPDSNVRLHDMDLRRRRIIVHVSGPLEAGSFYLYDLETRKLDLIGLQRPWLRPQRLAPTTALRIKSRDGVEVTAYLTRPLATGPRPLVVLPHGGPQTRDGFAFNQMVQGFAARGWMVLQPNFRGSSGYGRAFAEAGHRQWAGRMQEDVEDCVDHVLASGLVDPARVAICGASYGGYAAMMGAIRRPDLYRRVVSIAGVSDLPDLIDYVAEDGEDTPAYAYVLKTIGDPAQDRDALMDGSPRYRARELTAPVLLIHGSADGVVPIRQSRAMASALKQKGRAPRVLELKDNGHGDWEPDVWNRVIAESAAFIAEGFSDPRQAPPAPSP